MRYHQFQPHPILSQFVQCYWAIGAESRTLPAPGHGVIPGGYVDLVFNVGDQVCLSDSGGVFFDRASSFLAGPFDRYQRFSAKGKFDFLGGAYFRGETLFSPGFHWERCGIEPFRLTPFWMRVTSRQSLKLLRSISLERVRRRRELPMWNNS